MSPSARQLDELLNRAENREALEGIASGLADLYLRAKRWELCNWRAWDRVESSQRRAAQSITRAKNCVFFGGNRSGKTDLLRRLICCFAIGWDHPVAREFARINGIDTSGLPTGPGRCYLVALTHADSVRYHRGRIRKLLAGFDTEWHNFEGAGEARVTIQIPGHEEPAVIYCRALGPGQRSFQGDDVRAIAVDEEPDNEQIIIEAGQRLIDQDGWLLLGMTPMLMGLTWVHDNWGDGRRVPDWEASWLWTLHNPHVPADVVRRKLARLSAGEQAARGRGELTTGAGRVWASFGDGHLLTEMPAGMLGPESGWLRFRGLDWGSTSPTACVWGALSPQRDYVVLYRVLYEVGWTTAAIAARIRELEAGDGPVDIGWGDPHAPTQILDLRMVYGLNFWPGDNDRTAGLDKIRELFHPNEINGKPKLFLLHPDVEPSMAILRREIVGYTLDPSKPKESAVYQKDDHACDAMRYLIMGLRHRRYV